MRTCSLELYSDQKKYERPLRLRQALALNANSPTHTSWASSCASRAEAGRQENCGLPEAAGRTPAELERQQLRYVSSSITRREYAGTEGIHDPLETHREKLHTTRREFCVTPRVALGTACSAPIVGCIVPRKEGRRDHLRGAPGSGGLRS